MMMSRQTAKQKLQIMAFMIFVENTDKWIFDDESQNSNKNCKSWDSCYLLTNDETVGIFIEMGQ